MSDKKKIEEKKPEQKHLLRFGQIKGINKDAKTVKVVVSTATPDRDNEIILASAFEGGLENYKKNPVLLADHDRFTIGSIIGKAKNLSISENGLEAEFEYFVGQGNEKADWAFKLLENNIGAFSVGFIPKEWDVPVDSSASRVFTNVELFEISQVTIPANPEAVIQNSYEDGSIERQMCDLAVKAFNLKQENRQDKITEVIERENQEVEDGMKEILASMIEKIDASISEKLLAIKESVSKLSDLLSDIEEKQNEVLDMAKTSPSMVERIFNGSPVAEPKKADEKKTAEDDAHNEIHNKLKSLIERL